MDRSSRTKGFSRSGLRILLVSLGITLIGVLPLLLWMALTPGGEPPMGLVLLAVGAVVVGLIGNGGPIGSFLRRLLRRE